MKSQGPLKKLSDEQTALNSFLWSSELSYGTVLTTTDKRLQDKEQKLDAALADIVDAQVWYPNTKKDVHYRRQVGGFLKDVRSNITYIYRAVSIMWYSTFESYLRSKLFDRLTQEQQRKQTVRGGWGIFLDKLRADRFRSGTLKRSFNVDLMIQADFFREIRNVMVHSRGGLPRGSIRRWTPNCRGWEGKLEPLSQSVSSYWKPTLSKEKAFDFVREKVNKTIDTALKAQRRAKKRKKDIPLDYFFTLFSFTSFRKLAEDIDACVLP
jgi:hypothetical protein